MSTLELRDVIAAVQDSLASDPEWVDAFAAARGIHLGIFVEPYLTHVLAGRKTIESRFSVHRIAPFERVMSDDIVLLKRSSGPIVAIAQIQDSQSMALTERTWRQVRSKAQELCADGAFWAEREEKRFATLMYLGRVRELELPIVIKKRDPRPWVVLRDPHRSTNLRLF